MGEVLTLYGTLGLALQDVQMATLNNAIERFTQMMSVAERANPNLKFINKRVKVSK